MFENSLLVICCSVNNIQNFFCFIAFLHIGYIHVLCFSMSQVAKYGPFFELDRIYAKRAQALFFKSTLEMLPSLKKELNTIKLEST